jgi:hypothetical protein
MGFLWIFNFSSMGKSQRLYLSPNFFKMTVEIVEIINELKKRKIIIIFYSNLSLFESFKNSPN